MVLVSKKHAASPSSPWSNIPPELLGLILERLHSHTDRFRLTAVCRPWRSAIRLPLPLPPPMPWIVHGDGAYVDLAAASSTFRMLYTHDDWRFAGAAGDRLFLTRDSGGCFLVNPLSRYMADAVPVPDLAFFLEERTREKMFSLSYNDRVVVAVKKVVVAAAAAQSPDPLVAALVKDRARDSRSRKIFVCNAGAEMAVQEESYPAMWVELHYAADIAFFQGKLYALTREDDDELHLIELGVSDVVDDDGGGSDPSFPTIKDVKCVIKKPEEEEAPVANSDDDDDDMVALIAYEEEPVELERYLVVSGERLLMVQRYGWSRDSDDGCRFKVFEAELGESTTGRWAAAGSLHGRALFVGRRGSRSVVAAGDGRCGAQEDCVYFLRQQQQQVDVHGLRLRLPLPGAGVYNMRDGSVRFITPSPVAEPAARRRSSDRWKRAPTWFFPEMPKLFR